jgi:P pilus assembly chaperone PapD
MYEPRLFKLHQAHSKAFCFTALFCLFTLFAARLKAQGNLLIMPKRVVFDGSKKSQELNVANTGKDSARYVISVIEIRMKEDGSFERINTPDSGQNFANKYIRIFPRSVTLAPNEAQSVKVQLTNQGQLVPGEYRSHLYFRAIPDEKPLGETSREKPKDSSINVRLIPVFGISIPVLIRQGASNSQVNLSDVLLQTDKDKKTTLRMKLNRIGNMSVYGDISVEYISVKGKVTPVGMIKGLAVYTPNPMRQLSLALNDTKGINFSEGRLHIVYSDGYGTRPARLAETEILLQ